MGNCIHTTKAGSACKKEDKNPKPFVAPYPALGIIATTATARTASTPTAPPAPAHLLFFLFKNPSALLPATPRA
eukprot:scaffold12362_cov124-Isochrysis_galbana.AAC.4